VLARSELKKGFRIGDWEVLPGQGVMRKGDHEERPEPMVFEVLISLASRDGELVSREELIDEIWDGRPTSDEPINRCLSQLRGHLGDRERPYKYIETLTRRGYRLNYKVELLEPAPASHEQIAQVGLVRNQGRLWMVVGAIAVSVITAVIIRGGLGTDVEEIESGGQVRSIAVLPFDNLSGSANDQYIVSGFKEELVQTLHNIPDFAVVHGRVAYPDTEVADIAKILGVDAVLFGALQRDRDILKVNYQVARAYDGVNISSGSVTGKFGDVFQLQGRLAVLVRNDLVGESPQQLISASRNPNSDAYDRYMRGLDALEHRGRWRSGNLETAIELFEQAIQLDPGFGRAYLSLASAYVLLPDYRNAPLKEMHDLALATVARGIAADSSITDAAGEVIGFVHHKQRQWAQAEQAYIRATTAKVVNSNAFNWYSLMLAGVGRLDEALAQILIAQKIDPSSVVINTRLGMVYTWLDNSEKANEFLDRASQLDASWEMYALGKTLLLAREGRLDEAASLFRDGVTMAGGTTEWIDAIFAAREDSSLREAALTAIDVAFSDPEMDPRINVIIRTMLGDVDGAMQVAMSLASSDVFFEMDFLFTPELQPLRQHPEFPGLMQNLGIQSYWDDKGCVWLDDSISCPD